MLKIPLRLGRISFLNVLPIYYPLEAEIIPHDFELVSGPPALLNEMMAAGQLHASSCSCIEYARHPGRYYLVRDLSIGSRGPVLSVLLLSKKPLSELRGQEILISGESHTSVALLRLLLQDRYGINTRFRTGHVSSELRTKAPTAFLAIGDEALRLRNHPDYPYRLDLAEEWRTWTGLPFIFGLWVISANTVDKGHFTADPGEVLRKGRDWGLENMDVILDITEKGCPLNREELRNYYLNGLFYSLNESEQAGLREFYTRLQGAGIIEKIPELRFF